jgi:hypothetical protein
VTSYALELPLTSIEIPERYLNNYNEAKRRLEANPLSITSHTILIVDMSGSMSKSDMNGHRSRARGAYYNLAEEFIAARLHPIDSGSFAGKSTSFTDVVTLIEMRGQPTVVFESEPVSWVLFNTFVMLAEKKDTRDHGNYYESLCEAFSILDRSRYLSKCALCLFFFSDGKPSDFGTNRSSTYDEILSQIYDLVSLECSIYKDRLTFTSFGFGKNESEFDIMQGIVCCAKTAGANATFAYSYLDDSALGSALSSTATSLTATRTSLSRLDSVKGEERERNTTEKMKTYVAEAKFNLDEWSFFNNADKKCNFERIELQWTKSKKSGIFQIEWAQRSFLHPEAVGIAVAKERFGEGAERIVYEMSEINAKGELIGLPLVAKDSLWKQKKRAWHKTFVKTQMKAAKLAEKFNAKLDNLRVSKIIPRVNFLSCSVYLDQTDDKEGQREYAYLSEKRLNPDNYIKWNNNFGGVDGVAKVNIADYEPVQVELARPVLNKGLELVLEEDDEEEDEDEGDNDLPVSQDICASIEVIELEKRILESDIPQAFSHFTYRHTQRDELVCDLQGELNILGAAPYFDLTDPCIHSSRRKYGNTDKGGKGMNDFFRTHQCNAVCKMLKIANNSWR